MYKYFMDRNLKNIFKFTIAVLALTLFTYCICAVETEDFSLWHIAGMIAAIDIGIWYTWQVYKSN